MLTIDEEVEKIVASRQRERARSAAKQRALRRLKRLHQAEYMKMYREELWKDGIVIDERLSSQGFT